MAYFETLNMVAGDTLPELTLTLRDKNTAAAGATLDENTPATWAPINLTGATTRLKIREIGATVLIATLTCSIVDAANGKVATDFPAGTIEDAGQYEAEVEITFSDGGILTVYDLLKFKVRAGF